MIGIFVKFIVVLNLCLCVVYCERVWIGYEVVFDVFFDVFVYGILLVFNDLEFDEKWLVVVC